MRIIQSAPQPLLLATILLLILVPHVDAQTESSAIPFSFSSRNTAFGVQGDFEGNYEIHSDFIQVNLTKATIYVSENCPYQGRRAINTLNFGLRAPTSDGKWKIETRAHSVGLGLIMLPSEEQELELLSFRIPRKLASDLTQRWLIVEIQTDELDSGEGLPGTGYVFAVGCAVIAPKETSKVSPH